MGKRKKYQFGLIVFAILFIGAAIVSVNYLQKIYFDGVSLNSSELYIYVETGSTLSSLTLDLYEDGILEDTCSFLWVADKKSFNTPKAGRYLIKNKMSNNQLINLLRSGMQKPIKLTLTSSRSIEQLVSKASQELELDSIELINAIQSEEVANKFGFSSRTFPTMFIPNTYEFYWNTSVDEFLSRMGKEYKRFWNEENKAKAKEKGLSQSEVSILASIVQAEQQEHKDERAKVAGLYLNRLRRRMRLQSDPTLIYALGDFSIKRVLNVHKEINSPYNTYKNAGLPPGPINIPQISSIESVLNAEKHNYLYMCAKADFSGYHHFSSNLTQHNQYAKAYQRELNRRRILQ